MTPTINKLQQVSVLVKTNNIKVVSFDFFDTLAFRAVSETELLKSCYFKFKLNMFFCSFSDFHSNWELAISKCREQQTDTDEVYLEGIVETLCDAVSIEQMSFVKKFVTFYVENEMSALSLQDGAFAILAYCKKQNLSLLLLSDTYYSMQHIKRFLAKLKILEYFDQIYLSCEYGKSKASFELYKCVVLPSDIVTTDVLHIGDNYHSDVRAANKNGWLGTHFIKNASLEEQVTTNENLPSKSLETFGCDVLAPFIVGYCRWLYLNVKKLHLKQVIFLGRDGYVQYRVFKYLYGTEINCQYLLVNRVLKNQLKFNCLDERTLSVLKEQHFSEGLNGLISVFGLHDTSFSQALNHYTAERKIPLDSLIDDELKKDILLSNNLVSSFKESLSQRRDGLLSYLNQSSIDLSISSVWSDVGWRGSITRFMSHNFNDGDTSSLLCCLEPKEHDLNYITMDNHPEYARVLSDYRDLLEFCLGEAIGSCLYVNKDGKLQLNDINYEVKSAKEKIQKGVWKHLKDVGIPQSFKSDNECSAIDSFTNYVKNPDTEVIEELANIPLQSGIDGNSTVNFDSLLFLKKNIEKEKEALPKVNRSVDRQSLIYGVLELVSLVKSKREVVIYGIGSGFNFIFPHIEKSCIWAVDLNKKLHGKKIGNIDVNPIESLESYSKAILVTVIGRREQIARLLEKYDCEVIFLEDYLQ
jgi:FMN phosphatase YigB (HAD superfamily)